MIQFSTELLRFAEKQATSTFLPSATSAFLPSAFSQDRELTFFSFSHDIPPTPEIRRDASYQRFPAFSILSQDGELTFYFFSQERRPTCVCWSPFSPQDICPTCVCHSPVSALLSPLLCRLALPSELSTFLPLLQKPCPSQPDGFLQPSDDDLRLVDNQDTRYVYRV
jgi:hypothetical protein